MPSQIGQQIFSVQTFFNFFLIWAKYFSFLSKYQITFGICVEPAADLRCNYSVSRGENLIFENIAQNVIKGIEKF